MCTLKKWFPRLRWLSGYAYLPTIQTAFHGPPELVIDRKLNPWDFHKRFKTRFFNQSWEIKKKIFIDDFARKIRQSLFTFQLSSTDLHSIWRTFLQKNFNVYGWLICVKRWNMWKYKTLFNIFVDFLWNSRLNHWNYPWLISRISFFLSNFKRNGFSISSQ